MKAGKDRETTYFRKAGSLIGKSMRFGVVLTYKSGWHQTRFFICKVGILRTTLQSGVKLNEIINIDATAGKVAIPTGGSKCRCGNHPRTDTSSQWQGGHTCPSRAFSRLYVKPAASERDLKSREESCSQGLR